MTKELNYIIDVDAVCSFHKCTIAKVRVRTMNRPKKKRKASPQSAEDAGQNIKKVHAPKNIQVADRL